MIKIGITGSLASGKSTVVTLMSKNKYSIFSADKEVRKLYKEQKIVKRLKTIFKITSNRFLFMYRNEICYFPIVRFGHTRANTFSKDGGDQIRTGGFYRDRVTL